MLLMNFLSHLFGLETSLKGSNFIYDSVQLLYHKRHKINFKRGGSYIECPDWIKIKQATINPKNKYDKCFQYAAAVALNYGKIGSHPERISNVKPFINKCKWDRIKYT